MADCKYKLHCNGIDCDKSFCLRAYKLEELFAKSGLEGLAHKQVALRIESGRSDAVAYQRLNSLIADVVNVVKSGKNIYIHSAICGNGKTTFAVRFIEQYLYKTWVKADVTHSKALFISVPRFLLELKNSITMHSDYIDFIKENIMQADLVVWDDIGAKAATDFELNNLFSYIDGRIALGKSNIFTTNLSAAGLESALGARLASRICNLSESFEFIGSDKRQLGRGNE